MSGFYRILRLNSRIKSIRIKLLGIWLFHVLRKRYIGIFFDPVLACNFRCKMCYFSDAEKRKTYKGTLDYTAIESIAQSLFHRALKLQIGCGAEPTLHKDLVRIIALGKQYHIPHISLTTNGSLLSRDVLEGMAKAGLDEITISTHGLTRETYESLMVNGNFEEFRQVLKNISEIKTQYPDLKLRINYTINNDNLNELPYLWEIVGEHMDILQLRPIQKIGNSAYSDFDLSNIYASYDTIIAPLIKSCNEKGIVCLAPEKKNIIILEEDKTADRRIDKATYCYISPQGCWKEDFDYQTETFESYAKKHHYGRQLLRHALGKTPRDKVDVTRKMNYNIN
ncbi:radical SAM protein [Parabacteroides sp. 52]|uniref:radical SAM protein n=1 Tax=Parabacteroides sp. 52 TaxID=2302940 RepID=UPI0013D5AA9F|nr:radical SAM protein [Parabacteroides sp. 52]NDV54651.1 radical SAM protein [Parabacteroides sp. 52]